MCSRPSPAYDAVRDRAASQPTALERVRAELRADGESDEESGIAPMTRVTEKHVTGNIHEVGVTRKRMWNVNVDTGRAEPLEERVQSPLVVPTVFLCQNL